MTAPAQILANALQSAVDAVCNFARFVVNESRTRLTPPPPPPPLGICGSIAAAAGRIFGLVLLTTALAGAFAVGLQAESVKPQNFAFANLLAAPAFAQSGIPNPDFPPPAVQATANPLDTGDFQIKCEGVDGQLKSTHGAQDTLPRGDFCDGLSINHNGEEYSGCYVAYEIPFVSSSIHAIFAPLGENLPDCRNVIPFCPDSRKAPDLRGDTDNPFSACRSCADINRANGNPECGNCLADFVEDDEEVCRAVVDCSRQNRFQPNAYTCGDCLLDFTEDAGSCKADKNCAAENRAQTNAFTCGDCVSGFTEGAGSCKADKNCAAENRVQMNAYTCGDCLPGFTEGAESCQVIQFCAGQGRIQTNAYTCGECLPDHGKINEHCVHLENPLPEDRTTCAEVFGGDWVDLSAAHGAGKGVCSGIDINDTFCLTGTVSALPCLGLFNHVRSCNLLGRPALDPWHCAAACAGGKAAGARCLESE